MTDDEVLATARGLFGATSGWALRLEREGTRLLLRAEHPASSGLALSIEGSDPRMADHLETFSRDREVAIADAAPALVHPDLVMGVRALAAAYEWPAGEVRGVVFLLHEVGALTLEETSWLAGYVAADAPMAPVSPWEP